MRELTVASVMTTNVIAVRPETPFKAVVAALAANAVSAVPVIGPLGKVVGVVSEADVLAKQEFRGGVEDIPHGDRAGRMRWYRSRGLTAAEVMTTPVITIGAGETVTAAARRLAREGVRRLYAVDDTGRLVGVVSRRDVLSTFLRSDAEIRADIEQQVLHGNVRLASESVTVYVHDGVATLDGVVDRRSTTEVACRLAQAIPGVVGVHSNLQYQTDDS